MNNLFNFYDAIEDVRDRLIHGDVIDAARWQSINVPKSVKFQETTNVYFDVNLYPTHNGSLRNWIRDIQPNMPWAEDAFQERVSGIPWNPGKAWETWPYAKSAANFKQERFSHSYAERYWPKNAGGFTDQDWENGTDYAGSRLGIRFNYGDLHDVVKLMNNDPLTRQAYLPIFFPEDTGVVHGERIPCTLGYHFLLRDGKLSVTYYIRSCDFVRHFRDDLYMTLRLLMWMRESVNFPIMSLGTFTFHCVSMHCFKTDKL